MTGSQLAITADRLAARDAVIDYDYDVDFDFRDAEGDL